MEKAAKWETECRSLKDRLGEEQKLRENLQAKLDAVQACPALLLWQSRERHRTSYNPPQTRRKRAMKVVVHQQNPKMRGQPPMMEKNIGRHENPTPWASDENASPARAAMEIDQTQREKNLSNEQAPTFSRQGELKPAPRASKPLSPMPTTDAGRNTQQRNTQESRKSQSQHQKQMQGKHELVSATSSAATTPPEQRKKLLGNGAGLPGVTRATAVGSGGGNEASIRTLVVCDYRQDRTGSAANTPNQ
ncbi:hypothetical protein MRX96_039197 [Rhipicephalus microplus]